MLQALILDHISDRSQLLKNKLEKLFPNLYLHSICDKTERLPEVLQDNSIQLVFLNPETVGTSPSEIPDFSAAEQAFICVSNSFDFMAQRNYWDSVAYLPAHLPEEELIEAVEAARTRIRKRKQEAQKDEHYQKSQESDARDKLIGIPTMEGFEIIDIDSIIRCEGLQKCTRIVVSGSSDIVSSYHIGMYKKMLGCSEDFFSVHRSHLINIKYVCKFRKIGEIVMKDRSVVPIAKRRRKAFLDRIIHI